MVCSVTYVRIILKKNNQIDNIVVVMHEHFVYDSIIDLMTIDIAALVSQQPTNLIPAGDYASFIS